MSLLLVDDEAKTAIPTRGPFIYYVRMFWGFFEPPPYLHTFGTYLALFLPNTANSITRFTNFQHGGISNKGFS